MRCSYSDLKPDDAGSQSILGGNYEILGTILPCKVEIIIHTSKDLRLK